MSNATALGNVKFQDDGLVPAIVQSADDRSVRMLGYMNREALEATIETRLLHFWSRSRQTLWKKGESSGNLHHVESIHFDCDGDTLLVLAHPVGPTCHLGTQTCFDREPLLAATSSARLSGYVVDEVASVIQDRKSHPIDGSYTTYLFSEGVDKIGKKIGEEAAEVIIASKNGDINELANESADLIYHLLVMLEETGTDLNDVWNVLAKRRGRPQPDDDPS